MCQTSGMKIWFYLPCIELWVSEGPSEGQGHTVWVVENSILKTSYNSVTTYRNKACTNYECLLSILLRTYSCRCGATCCVITWDICCSAQSNCFLSQLFCTFCQVSFECSGRQQKVLQVLRFLSCTWDTCLEFLAPAISHFHPVGNRSESACYLVDVAWGTASRSTRGCHLPHG